MSEYVNKAELYAEIVEHYWPKVQEAKALGLPMPPVPESIALKFRLIVNGMAKRYNFNRYSFLDDMKTRGLVACLSKAYCFDPSKSNNPFGYFSRIVWQEFVNEITEEEDESYVKAKLFYDCEAPAVEETEDGVSPTATPYFNVEDFERKRGIKNALSPKNAKQKKNPHINTAGPLMEEEDFE